MFGFMGKILRVNLTTGEIREAPVPEKRARMFLCHWREKPAPCAVPKAIEFRDSLPLTVMEKRFKKRLREEKAEKASCVEENWSVNTPSGVENHE